MMRRSVLTIWVTVVCALSAYSQPAYYSKRLAYIAHRTGLSLPASLPAELDDDSTFVFQKRALRIRTNSFGDVSHIGYRIFPRGLQSNDYLTLFNFVERYLLEMDFPSEDFTPAERMNLDHVVVTRGTLTQLKSLTPDTPFSVEEIERRMYRLKWHVDGDSISLTVPMDYQLMVGANSIELEEFFERDIVRYLSVPSGDLIGEWEDAAMVAQGDYCVIRMGEYLSPDIRSDVYLKKNGEHYCLLADERKPVQSLTNVILTAHSKEVIPLTLILNRYGGRRSKMHVSLQQLVAYFEKEGCRLYVGVKSFDNQTMEASLFAYHPHLAYNHLVSLKVPAGILRGEAVELQGVVYTYIPLQNLTEQFFIQGLEK